METGYVVLSVSTAAMVLVAAWIDVGRAEWVRGNMAAYGVPEWALTALCVIKAVGGIGLLAGVWYPPLGLAAALGLAVYFLGAVVVVARARWYRHLRYPVPFLLLAAVTMGFAVAVI
ncbi:MULTISPECIES: DoxX family protein [unclassified Nocardia]|uniref:DoxX family protein n=1 Tax=unclassified Nocardia TaxID=2637762 RepID=UPI001CE3EE2C|nr:MULTISPECIES: DoxX family protein [unclassified Nocardia]